MEELIPKVIEFGALAVINVLLIFKGVAAIKELSESVTKLADKVDRMSDYVNSHITLMETRLAETERDLRDIKGSLDILVRRLEFNDRKKNEGGGFE